MKTKLVCLARDPEGNDVRITEGEHAGVLHCAGCRDKSERTAAFYQDAGHGDSGPFCTMECAVEDAQEQHGPTDEELDYTYGSDGWRGK